MSLNTLLSRLAGRRVTVIGDVMLDHFVVGQVDRISPEAPVPVVRFAREEFRLGGAANVANNIAALGGRASIIGLVGADAEADRLRQELRDANLGAAGLVADASRPTTRKVRVVTLRNQQVARIDYEADGDASGSCLAELLARIKAAGPDSEAIVLSDYRKGVVTPAVVEAAVSAARSAGIPLLVDPKVPMAERYRGATLITPNHHEAELMTQVAIRNLDDAQRAARVLHERTGASVLITWGEHGMFVFDAATPGSPAEILPASAREVSDVTGAGDTVIAVLALGLAAGGALGETARLANLAAGLVVARFGPAALTAAELSAAIAQAAASPSSSQ
jgi:D-beta-D-heptose 7-phosphate kinase/D-beta-D-heptose 1-phosphate adenosyltransferase